METWVGQDALHDVVVSLLLENPARESEVD